MSDSETNMTSFGMGEGSWRRMKDKVHIRVSQ